MAEHFEMDPGGTDSGLANSDASASAQPGSGLGSLRAGAYTTPLLNTILGIQTAREANAEIRVVTNAVSRQVSVAAVEITEAANSGALTV